MTMRKIILLFTSLSACLFLQNCREDDVWPTPLSEDEKKVQGRWYLQRAEIRIDGDSLDDDICDYRVWYDTDETFVDLMENRQVSAGTAAIEEGIIIKARWYYNQAASQLGGYYTEVNTAGYYVETLTADSLRLSFYDHEYDERHVLYFGRNIQNEVFPQEFAWIPGVWKAYGVKNYDQDGSYTLYPVYSDSSGNARIEFGNIWDTQRGGFPLFCNFKYGPPVNWWKPLKAKNTTVIYSGEYYDVTEVSASGIFMSIRVYSRYFQHLGEPYFQTYGIDREFVLQRQ